MEKKTKLNVFFQQLLYICYWTSRGEKSRFSG